MWTIIGGILATASRIDEGGGDKDLNIYLTDNAGFSWWTMMEFT